MGKKSRNVGDIMTQQWSGPGAASARRYKTRMGQQPYLTVQGSEEWPDPLATWGSPSPYPGHQLLLPQAALPCPKRPHRRGHRVPGQPCGS